MKIPKKVKSKLKSILYDLDRANGYLNDPDIVGIAKETDDPHGADYTIRTPEILEISPSRYSKHVRIMSHEAGSAIVGVYRARRQLEQLLEEAE